jgi:folate-binding protein YgfZ
MPQQGARVADGRRRGPALARRADAHMNIYERPDAGVVTVEGPDAISFLQSLVSQDLDPLGDGDHTRALMLQPQGKLTAVFDLFRLSPEAVVLVTDEGYGSVLAEAIKRFKIRVKADVVDRTGAWSVLAVDGASPIVGPADEVAAKRAELVAGGAVLGDADAYEAARIIAGAPRLGVDIDETTIPQEAFLERDTVSFTKGCFVGQELVCRIDTRGHVNRYLRKLVFADAMPERGATIVAGDKEVGAITSVAPTETGAVALGMIRREVEPPADVTVRWNGHEARAQVV